MDYRTLPEGYPPPTSVPAGYPPPGYPPYGYSSSPTLEQPVCPPLGYPALTRHSPIPGPARYGYTTGSNPHQHAGYCPGGYGYPPLARPPKRSQGFGMAGLGSVVMAGLFGGDFLGGSAFDPADYYSWYNNVAEAIPYDVSA